MANNIRWLGSGPRCGFYEINIPDIIPGKVDPVSIESLMQVASWCASTRGAIAEDTTP